MKYYALKIRNCRVLLCLLLFSLSFYVHSDSDDGLVFDPDGQFINFPVNDRHITLSSYDMDDHDVSYLEILKLDASGIFLKDADLTNGIKAEIGDGGYIELKVMAYDNDHNKHLIYRNFLDLNSPDTYGGDPGTETIEIFHGDVDSHQRLTVAMNDIKTMLQKVKNTFSLAKEVHEQHLHKAMAYYRQLETTDRHPRGIRNALLFGAIAAIFVVGVVGIVASGGLAAPALLPIAFTCAAATITIIDGTVVAGALVAAAIGAGVGAIVDDEIVFGHHYPVVEVGNTNSGGYFSKINLDDKVYPAGAYPVQVRLEMQNARFYSAKVPGLPELTPQLFNVWHEYAPQHVNQLIAGDVWDTSPGVLDEGDSEVPDPRDAASQLSGDDLDDNTQALVRLTVNPESDGSFHHYFDPDSTRSVGDEPVLKLGDHVTLEVVVPVQSGHTFDESNPEHYPRLENFPYTWRAHFSGEALYQCEPSIQPGEWRPWLGYDSQVHGAAMRKYPEGFSPKFYDWHLDASNAGFVVFSWTAKMTRRMDADISSYSPVHTWPKQKTSPVIQRNNQKEGLNMELLRAWKDHAQATDSTPDFANYSGSRILPGLDPDEFLYLRNSEGAVTDIITLDGEPWKQVPAGEAANPLNDIVTAYKKNRMWHVDGQDYRDVFGADYVSNNYEIQDLGTNNLAPNGNATGNNAASGHVIIRLPSFAPGGSTINMWLDVEAPLDDDKGFYGNIAGTVHPSVWETGVPFVITGLDTNRFMHYAVSFIYENSFGRRKYLNLFSENESDDVLDHMEKTGNWLVMLPSMQGYGYYTVNLWSKNPNYTDSWTRIGGKELLDISLRFMSVPAGLSGVNASNYPGVALKESPGDGAHIYLDDFLDRQQGDYGAWKFSRYGKVHARTYVFNEGDTTTFEVFDADPHTFTHRGTEWYLSSRTQAKWVSDEQLEGSLKFYVDPIKSNGKVKEDNRADGTGKKFTHEWNNVGIYQLKAVYNGTGFVAHRIVVVDNSARQNNRKADIKIRNLTTREIGWLNDFEVILGPNSKLLSIDNVDSIYRYIDGPRMHTGNQVNRFHPGLDYADGYKWRIGRHNSLVEYDPDSYDSIAGLTDAISTFHGVMDSMAWGPNAFVRHTSEKSSDGQPMPDDIANGSVSASHFASLSSNQNDRINALFNNVPEPWQVRLPWISFVTDPNPYGDTDNLSYRIRTNIKVIYDMDAFFNNDNGAFSGNPVDPANGDYSYPNLRDLGIYLHLMEDDTKLLREFFRNLATGRMIIIEPPSDSFEAHVSNAKGDGSVIATY